jgi:hypothetical protein
MTIVNHGYKEVPTEKVRAPGDIEKVRKEQHTVDLGESLASTGGKPADPIIVEHITGRLLGGKHRFAAALNKRLPKVWVLMLEGTAEELEQACLVEQIRRRKATDQEIARLVELEHPTPEQTFPDVPDDEDEPEEEARPRTKREAIEKVAALTGRTPAAVQQADYRAKKASDPEYSDRPSTCLDWLGLLVDEEVERDAQIEHSFLEGIEKALVKLQGDCTRHADVGLNEYQHMRDTIHRAATIARFQLPDKVCPHCKLIKLLRKGCLACRGRGWLREEEARNIPAPLLQTGDKAGVYVDGKWTLLGKVK